MSDEAPTPVPPKRRHVGGTIIAILLIVAGIVAAFVIDHKRQKSLQWIEDPEGVRATDLAPRKAEDLPIKGTVAAFSLTDASGKTVTLESLRGRVWVGEFFFTYCGAICTKMTPNFAALHRAFTGKDEPKFVSFSVDPSRDTLEVLTDYARIHQADTDRWLFLRNDDEKVVLAVADSMELPYKIGDPSAHSSRFVLVDREGRIRGTYIGTEASEMIPLRRDLKALLEAPKN